MTPERWQEVAEQMEKALRLKVHERSPYLAQLAVNDPDLHREVESLLASHQEADTDFLKSPMGRVPPDASSAPLPTMLNRRVGSYQVVELIGVGGMGEVYRAFRADDQYRKQVALKVVLGGEDSGFVISRFKNERQILASLEHPNIARLLDGGTTEDGAPYFVMELIEGESIDQYCDHHKLVISERLKLFLQVSSAVQFAHQRLIIHRDIKPSNILVTGDGTPKLLDFGIAKILDTEAAADGFQPTLTVFRMLTPGYASPEQIKGEPITTASDVYSLGVVLYELLTGRSPYQVNNRAAQELARAVCEYEPEKPSMAVRRGRLDFPQSNEQLKTSATVSAPAEGSSEKLQRRLRGDLDNIVLMAMRKEPHRRYVSVEQFATDIRRHLEDLPVIARKDTARYRASKFVSRHKAGVVATAVVAITLIVGFVITVREARIAQRRFNDVRSLANSLIFDVHDSIKDLPGSTPARKIIVDRALQYLNTLARESNGDLGLQRELATAYERVGLVQGHYMQDNLGDSKGSLYSYQQALEIRKQVDVKSHDWNDRLTLAQSYRLVAEMLTVAGKVQQARDCIDHAIAISEALNQAHPKDPQVLYEMGLDYGKSSETWRPDDPNGKFGSLDDIRKALTTDEAALSVKPDDLRTLDLYASALGSIGQYLVNTDPRAALPYYQRELEIERRLTQRSSAITYANRVAHAYGQITGAYEYMGDNAREFENATKVLAIFQDLSREDPKNASLGQHLAIAYTNVALALARLGKFKSSLDDWTKSAEIMRKLVLSAPENQSQRHYLASVLGAGGTILLRADQPEAALTRFGEMRVIDQSLRDAGAASPFDVANIAACSEKMGEASALAGNLGQSGEYFQQALTVAEPLISKRNQTPDYFQGQLNALYAAADAYSGLGDLSVREAQEPGQAPAQRKPNWVQARSWYAKSLETWHRIGHPNHTAPNNSFDVGDPTLVARKLQRCEAELAAIPSN